MKEEYVKVQAALEAVRGTGYGVVVPNLDEIEIAQPCLLYTSNSAFLALSGGFQDAYTYNARNEVFCNAQTGNVVLMSQHFMAGELTAGLGYFFPIIFFALGVWVAEKIRCV